jgi:hypothetical protein
MQLMTAAACGIRDRHEEARTAIESLRKHNPTFLDLKNVREDIAIWDPDKDALWLDDLTYFASGVAKPSVEGELCCCRCEC